MGKHSKKQLTDLESTLKKLNKEGIVGDYNLDTGKIVVLKSNQLVKKLEKHVFTAFRLAFPDALIRKSAVDLYLATLANTYLKIGLDKESTLITMMVVLEKESEDNFSILSKALRKNFDHYNFEKIKMQ